MGTEILQLEEIKVDLALNLRQEYGDLEGLRNSIREMGLTDPITVRKTRRGGYIMVKGYRRRQACEDLGLTKIECFVLSPKTKLVDALLLNFCENVVRMNLNPMEEAEGIGRLQDEGLTKEEILAKTGWTKAMYTQRHKLLSYTIALQAALRDARISVGQATQIARLPAEEHEKFIELAERLVLADLRKKIDKKLGNDEGGEDPESAPDPDPEEDDNLKEDTRQARNAVKKTFRALAKKVDIDKEIIKLIDVKPLELDTLNAMAQILENVDAELKETQSVLDEMRKENEELKAAAGDGVEEED
jgi:ParB/RepB/Spo0J family partition protein